jgi:hypothetical protein
MCSKNAHACAQNAENDFGFDFFYSGNGDEFLNHIIDYETWVSFVNVETKEHSKVWMHTHSPNKLKDGGNCFLV